MLDIIKDVIEELERIKIFDVHKFTKNLVASSGRRFFIIGNGGSASTASHFAADLQNLGYDAACLADSPARVTSLVNDKGWGRVYTEQMAHFVKDDALVVFTVHGCTGAEEVGPWSQNILEAVQLALKIGGEVFLFSGLSGGYFKDHHLDVKRLTVKSGDTDVVEGIHLVLTHQICSFLKEIDKR